MVRLHLKGINAIWFFDCPWIWFFLALTRSLNHRNSRSILSEFSMICLLLFLRFTPLLAIVKDMYARTDILGCWLAINWHTYTYQRQCRKGHFTNRYFKQMTPCTEKKIEWLRWDLNLDHLCQAVRHKPLKQHTHTQMPSHIVNACYHNTMTNADRWGPT